MQRKFESSKTRQNLDWPIENLMWLKTCGIGILVMLSFLGINGIKLVYSDEELVNVGLSLASGNMTYDDLLKWIKQHKK